MTDYNVVTIGLDSFDSLHALGLGVALAEITSENVELQRTGLCYHFSASNFRADIGMPKRLDQIITLPSGGDLNGSPDAVHADADGLLAATFTVPGARVVSIADAWEQSARSPDVIPRAMAKIKTRIARLDRDAARSAGASKLWLIDMLKDYQDLTAKIPVPARKASNHVAISIPFDPAFGYATRRPRDDGLISDGHNLQLDETQYAVQLIHIGAARYLRGQRVGRKHILLSVPVFDKLTIQLDAALPGLQSSTYGWRRALLIQWLGHWQTYGRGLAGISYQVLQTQAAKQSISVERGYLPYSLLAALPESVSSRLCERWHGALTGSPDGNNLDLVETLTDFLMSPNSRAFQMYLRDIGLRLGLQMTTYSDRYDLEEVRSVMSNLNPPDMSMSTIFSREAGTLRLGRSLRLLGAQNPSALREAIEDLENVRQPYQLLAALTRSIQQCVLAKAKSEFIIVPYEEDIDLLLEDTVQLGLQNVVALLVILSVVRYPPRPEQSSEPTDPQPDSPEVNTPI